MSRALVAKWRRLALLQKEKAESFSLDDFAKRVDGYARADTFRQCAASLQRSIALARRKARKGAQ